MPGIGKQRAELLRRKAGLVEDRVDRLMRYFDIGRRQPFGIGHQDARRVAIHERARENMFDEDRRPGEPRHPRRRRIVAMVLMQG
jgi:hypothetical protein